MNWREPAGVRAAARLPNRRILLTPRPLTWLGLSATLIALVFLPAAAQSSTITPLVPFEGTLSVPGETEAWTFSGTEGAVVSILVNSTGTLDPVVELRNSTGQILTSNDDFAYPGRSDSLLQAVSLPRIDTYTINVYGFGQTIGDYSVTMIPGYAEVAEREDFSTPDSWTAAGSESALVEADGGQLTLTLDGIRQAARITREGDDPTEDYYAQARINVQRAPMGWRVGFALRATDSGYYALMMGSDSAWRMDYVNADGTTREIRDWTAHPAIRAGATTFTLGVLANGRAFDVFFDGAWIGQAVESQTNAPDSGLTGFYGATPDAIGSGLIASFDDLLVTRPLKVGEIEVMPSSLVPGGQALTVQELERRRVVSTGGRLALTVPESSGRQVEPGVNRVPLGRGAVFSDYVLYTTFTLTTAVPNALVGCGVLFGNLSDTEHAVAFLDRAGGYGISARQGGNYMPGLFGENPAFATAQRHSLILVKRGLRAELFVDRQHVGGYDLPAAFDAPAQIGNAVVNYERSDTSCSFGDTWVWDISG